MFGLRWCFSIGNFIVISILIGAWRSFVFSLGVLWRTYKKSLSVIAGRSLELCQSLYLTPALAVGLLGWMLVFGGLVAVAAVHDTQQVFPPIVTLLAGASLLYSTRLLIRRGCL